MNSITRYALTFALAAGAALIPLRASAQTTQVKGEFQLPVKTHFGQLTLAPGHYTLAVQRMTDGQQLLQLRGPEGPAVKILGAFSFVNTGDVNYLRIQKMHDSYALTEFHCGVIGEAYKFRVPKELQSEARNRGGAQETLVAVRSYR